MSKNLLYPKGSKPLAPHTRLKEIFLKNTFRKADVFLKAGEYVKVLEICDQILRADPKNATMHYLSGLSYDAEGLQVSGAKSLKQAIRCSPKWHPPHEALGNLYFDQQQYANAIKCYIKALECGGTHACLYNNIGYLYEGFGHLNHSLFYYKKAVVADPENKGYHGDVARLKKQGVEVPKALSVGLKGGSFCASLEV